MTKYTQKKLMTNKLRGLMRSENSKASHLINSLSM